MTFSYWPAQVLNNNNNEFWNPSINCIALHKIILRLYVIFISLVKALVRALIKYNKLNNLFLCIKE